MQRKLLGIISKEFHATGQLLNIYAVLEKKWEYNFEAVPRLFTDFKKAYDYSFWRDIWYNILTEVGISMELVRLIKMCLNETYRRVWVGKHLYDMFLVKNGLTEGDALSPLFLTLLWN
jgi:Reverse transcriptase (RNA-dependent DNA polymerase).